MGGNIRLNKNEVRVLKLLLDNSRITDSKMSEILKISSQAIGKIRRKLEKSVINSYSLKVNYESLGITTFAIGLADIEEDKLEGERQGIEKELLDNPHVLQLFRVPSGNIKYIALYGFRDLAELDCFFNHNKKEGAHLILKNSEFFTLSHNNLIKDCCKKLCLKVLDNFNEISIGNNRAEINGSKTRY